MELKRDKFYGNAAGGAEGEIESRAGFIFNTPGRLLPALIEHDLLPPSAQTEFAEVIAFFNKRSDRKDLPVEELAPEIREKFYLLLKGALETRKKRIMEESARLKNNPEFELFIKAASRAIDNIEGTSLQLIYALLKKSGELLG